MDREKRIELVKAMSVILEALSDEEVYDTFEGKVPTKEDLEEDIDFYLTDKQFGLVMDSFVRMTTRARQHDGYWCNGVSSEEGRLGRTEVEILSARKAPVLENQIVLKDDTRWIISGVYGRTPFIAASHQVVSTEKLVKGDDLLDYKKRYGTPFTSAEERMLLRTLAKMLKDGAVEGLTPEEAEIMEANWRENDRKGEEW